MRSLLLPAELITVAFPVVIAPAADPAELNNVAKSPESAAPQKAAHQAASAVSAHTAPSKP